MKSLDLDKIYSELKAFSEARDWDQFHSVKNLAMALSVETSELTEIFQWMKEDDSNKAHLDPVLKQKVQEEVADIFVYLLRIAGKLEIDLESSVLAKMKKNEEKYPVDKARGSSKKYDEF